MNITARQTSGRSRGFSYVEALLLVTMLGITGAATGQALTAVVDSPKQSDDSCVLDTILVDKMEYLRSLPFSSLAADVGRSPSNYTDTSAGAPVIHGSPVVRTVAIWYVTPSTGAFSPIATHMVRITITANSRSLISLANEP
ncbi:MAG TPA: hypothetical protein VHQ47_04195 [Phycisphaerae bacterium]|jgi:hypothetical protein|nr:hypothetical protein [Phycisphaerae bacterium]